MWRTFSREGVPLTVVTDNGNTLYIKRSARLIVTFFKETRQEMARAEVMQNLGNRMVTIMDIADGSVHRRHYDQIHFQGQETEQDGDNPDDVDPDEQSERQRFMPCMLKPSGVALSGTPILVMSEEGPSASMMRQVTDSWVPLKEPAIFLAPARNAPVPITSSHFETVKAI